MFILPNRVKIIGFSLILATPISRGQTSNGISLKRAQRYTQTSLSLIDQEGEKEKSKVVKLKILKSYKGTDAIRISGVVLLSLFFLQF